MTTLVNVHDAVNYILWTFEIFQRCNPEEVMVLIRSGGNTAIDLGAKSSRDSNKGKESNQIK